MADSDDLISQAINHIDNAMSVDKDYALLHAQIANTYALVAVVQELQFIRDVMMDYVAENTGIRYTRG